MTAHDEFIKENTEPEQETSKSAANKTPDGKYDIAPSNLQNEDGTYTQQLGTGDPSDVSVPTACTKFNSGWTAESASEHNGKSNLSKIPYSDITVENAAEAFPYLGYIGYSPDYLEIFPDDSEYEINMKIWNNLVGTDCSRYYRYSTADTSDGNKEIVPTHFFSSEAEWNEFRNRRVEERRKADEAAKRSQERIDSGNYGFDSGLEEENQELVDYFESLGF